MRRSIVGPELELSSHSGPGPHLPVNEPQRISGSVSLPLNRVMTPTTIMDIYKNIYQVPGVAQDSS